MLVVFFFKQKTAYEMRISDWSSDVCSSDLRRRFATAFPGLRFAVRAWLSLFAYPLSGGYQSWSLVPEAVVGPLLKLENLLLPLLGPIMAFRLAIILERRADHSERSEESRVGKEWVSKFRYRWVP